MKIASSILGLMFLTFALVQINDPDPLLWIAIYGAMVTLSVMAFFNKYSKVLMIGLAIGYCIYAALLLTSAITWLQSADRSLLFDDIAKMQFPYIEETREFLGLAICIITLMVYYFFCLKALPQSSESEKKG
jgi:hypothetical protein